MMMAGMPLGPGDDETDCLLMAISKSSVVITMLVNDLSVVDSYSWKKKASGSSIASSCLGSVKTPLKTLLRMPLAESGKGLPSSPMNGPTVFGDLLTFFI